jgi:hypothetical protein
VAARYREDVEGEETAREVAGGGGYSAESRLGSVKLWRGVKDDERMIGTARVARSVDGANTSEAEFPVE